MPPMSRGFAGAVLKGLGARDHIATVVSSTKLAPHFLRVRFAAPTLMAELERQPGAWLRFWFPDPVGGEREHQRGYTIANLYTPQGEFDVDVLLHQPPGPGSLWFERAKPGDAIAVMSYGSRFRMPDPLPVGFLIIGDMSALPAINSLIAALPSTPLELYLEQTVADDALVPLSAHANLRVHRVERSDEASLAAAVERRDRAGWYAWVAGEARSTKLLREALQSVHGFDKERTYIQPYWTKGKSGH
jgi:ATP-binding cassette subfamily B protein IrtA